MAEFHNYPRTQEHDYPFKPRTVAPNPVLRGTALSVCATLVETIPGISGFLYKKNGWGSLNTCEGADKVDARYDPTVIPLVPASEGGKPDTASLTAVSLYEKKAGAGGVGSFHSVLDFHEAYKSGQTTPTDVVETLLSIIQEKGDNAFATAWIDLNLDLIRQRAAESTRRWKEGKPLGVLDGVPTAVKDEADLKGYYKKAYGSRIPDMTHPSDTTSWCCEKWEETGAIIVGKLNMHEIGLDTSGCNPTFGSPINPYNDQYFSGGSSSGSASAVAAGLLPFSLGCDGGGSIRLPSSWCGVYGLKTTHGWVSTRPYDTPAFSTSVAGPHAANMVDLEVAWRVMAQPDPDHHISKQFPFPSQKEAAKRPKRIGVFRDWIDMADEPVKAACYQAIDYFGKELGYEIVDITIPHVHQAQLAHALSILNEATVTMPKHQVDLLSPANRILLSIGHQTSVTDFLYAQRIRGLIMEHMAFLFQKYPGLIICNPTTPNAGWPKHPGDQAVGTSNGNQSLRNMTYVWLANFAGLPSMSMPVGYVDPVQGEGKFPVGMMATGEWGSEDQLIAFGYEAEEYLHRKVQGGRLMPRHYVDLLAQAKTKSKA